MPATQSWKQILLSITKAQGIVLSPSDIEIIKQSSNESSLARWVLTDLNPTHLLSEDELRIWRHIEQRKHKTTASESRPTALSVPLSEENLQHLIAFLETSTKAIDTHVDVLESQQTCLHTYLSKQNLDSQDESVIEKNLQRKQEVEVQQLQFMNSDALATLESKLGFMQDKADKALKAIPSIASQRLKIDDRTLDNIEQSMNATNDAAEFDASAQQTRVNELIAALQQATTLSLKDRLDRIYLEELHHLESSNPESNSSSTSNQQVQQVKEDLEMLYTEIDDVAGMVIQHEHGNQLNNTLDLLRARHATQVSETRHNAHQKLVIMTECLNELAQRYESLRSHRIIIEQMQANLKSIQRQRHNINTTTSSTANTPKVADTTTKAAPTPALTALMQHLNLKTPQTQEPSYITQQATSRRKDITQAMAELESTIHRTVKTRDLDVQTLVAADAGTMYNEQMTLIHELDEATLKAKAEVESMAHDTTEAEGAAVKAREALVRTSRRV